MIARVTPTIPTDELRGLDGDSLLERLLHEELWVVGGANDRGETVTEETVANRNRLRGEIRMRLQLLENLRAGMELP